MEWIWVAAHCESTKPRTNHAAAVALAPVAVVDSAVPAGGTEHAMSAQDAAADRTPSSSIPLLGETQADYRRRMALVQAEALERRQQELDQQRSPSNTPADRIRIWERLHQVELPRSPEHRLIGVIAAHTGLSPDEVRDEQRLRAAAKAVPRAS